MTVRQGDEEEETRSKDCPSKPFFVLLDLLSQREKRCCRWDCGLEKGCLPLPLATGCTTCPPPCDSCRDLDKGQSRELSSCVRAEDKARIGVRLEI